MKQLFLLLLLFQLNCLIAQQITITNAENNELLIGATVTIKNEVTKKIRVHSTDFAGKVNLNQSAFKGTSTLNLTVSYIGFETTIDSIKRGENKTISIQPKAHLIDDVVITAQYAPTSVEKSVHKVKVISRQKMDNMAAVNVQDVLTNELNVRISQDNILGSGLSLQGINGQNVKILIDGVPVIGRLDGQIDLGQINLNNVERIEIVEGPLSVNYGSNALAGTINIITKKNQKEKLHLGVNAYTENIGKYNLETNIGYSPNENHNLNLSVGRNYFDGWNPDDDFLPSFSAERADSGRAKQWNPKEQYFGRLQYNYKVKELLFSYKGELFTEKISNFGLPRRTLDSYVAFDDYYHTNRIDNALFAQGKLNNKLNLKWTAAYNDYERIKEAKRKDLVSLESTIIPESATNDAQDTSTFNLFMSRGSIATANDSNWFNYEIGYDINIENATGERIEGTEQKLGDYAAFISTEVKALNKIIIKPAVRYSYNTKYNAPITPSVNLKFAKKNSIVRFSYAKGFRAPSLKELYFNFNDINHSLFGNSDLKAEKSNNYTASIRQKILVSETLFKIELAGFYNEIYDQISFAQTSTTTGDSLIYFNIGKSHTKGLNLTLSANYENLTANLGASYIGRSNRLSSESVVDDFSYSTEVTGNVSYTFKKPQITISAFAKHQGELPGFSYDTNGEIVKQTIESYQIVDATLAKNFLKKKINVAIGCKNILNVQNVDSNISSGAHSVSNGSISVGTGRTAFVRLKMNLNLK